MRHLWIMLALIAMSAHGAIYKWVDKDGKVHYSDEPHPNAEVVQLNENTQNSVTIPAPKPLNITPAAAPATTEQQSRYQLSITSPQQEATIRSNAGDLTVAVNVEPQLASGHQLQLFIDGVAATELQAAGIFQLHDIDRGEHQIEAKVVLQNGKVLASSSATTFFMHQAGLIQPVFPAPSVKKN
ncbi:DUF4124 domain-containing protein [Shewanella sp. A3A]|nr:DUF4124 domain-containing protein [Shewanella ferrihydritica]